MSLKLSPAFSSAEKPVNATSLPSEAYVLSLASLPSYYAAASSAPTNAIYIFDKSNLKPVVQTLPGHKVAITALRSVRTILSNRDALLSCGKDGVVRTWDVRTGTVGLEMSSTGKEAGLLCCDASADGLMVAAGTEFHGDGASILYWDPRNAVAPIRTHSSTHSDDITAVHFSLSLSSEKTLLSASSDGLITTSNPDEEDEDEAVLHVGNWGCSVSKVGWIMGGQISSDKAPRVWAASDMETFSTWSNEFDLLQDLDRSRFTHPDPQLTWVTDYIIDCHDTQSDLPCIFAGSNEGDIALLHPPTYSDANDQWTLHRTFTSKHEGVVRSTLWDEENGILLSGGEDSKINAWICPSEAVQGHVKSDGMEVDSPPLKRSRHAEREEGAKRNRTG